MVVKLVNELYKKSPRIIDIVRTLRERNITARIGKEFTSEQVKRLIQGYHNSFIKTNGMLGRHIRRFIEAVA